MDYDEKAWKISESVASYLKADDDDEFIKDCFKDIAQAMCIAVEADRERIIKLVDEYVPGKSLAKEFIEKIKSGK